MNDIVNNPEHYKQGSIECIEAIKAATGDNFKGYLHGNALKYLWRHQHKGNPVTDLKKAIWYINKLMEEYNE